MPSKAEQQIHATVDRLIAAQQRYAPIELLLATGRLPYPRYEAWRSGEQETLDEGLAGNRDRIVEMLETAARWATRLGLCPHDDFYRSWRRSGDTTLRISRDPVFDRLVRTQYRRAAEEVPQLDLFFDSGATAALNDLMDALSARDHDEAERHLAVLAELEPDHRLLPAAESLVDALGHLDRTVEDAAAEFEALQRHLLPRAEQLLETGARDFLAPFWRRLADALPPERFDPARDHLHPSAIAARYLDWPGVIAAVEAVADFANYPILLARLAEAKLAQGRSAEGLAVVCQLCWRHSESAENWLANVVEPFLADAREGFWDLEPEPAIALFPAWLLIADPGLFRQLPGDLGEESGEPGHAFTVIHRLRDRDDVALRGELKAIHEGLFRAWLAQARQ